MEESLNDIELLRRFVRDKDQAAFARVVGRHVNWVDSMARRLVGGEALAADVTQGVFILLARKAGRIGGGVGLSSWLFTATRYAAFKALRMEARRRKHERIAATMRAQTEPISDATQWDDLAGMVDELVNRLRRADRRAVLLRFYEQKSFLEIGMEMSISEEAARKRVNRAVDRLREAFGRRGVTTTAAGLGTALAGNLTQPASAATLAATVGVGAGTSASGAAGLIAQGAGAMMAWGSVKVAAGVVLVILLGVTGAAVMQLGGGGSARVAAVPATMPATAPAGVPETGNGRVLGPNGQPVAGARVMLLEIDEFAERRIVREAISTASGYIHLPPPPDNLNRRSDVLIQAAGFGLSPDQWYGYGIPEDPVELWLRPPTALRVRFVAPDGAPVAGVRVWPTMLGTTFFSDEIGMKFAQTTDADGVVVFPSLGQNLNVRLILDDDRFGALEYADRKRLGETPQTDGGTIQLTAAGGISGRLYHADTGAPAAGVRVMARAQNASGSPDSGGNAITDSQGRYFFGRLRPATYNITVSPLQRDLRREYTAYALEGVEVAAGQHVGEQDLKLIRGGVIRGRAYVVETGQPLPGLAFSAVGPAHPRSGGGVQSTRTGEDGVFIHRVPPGVSRIGFQGEQTPGVRPPSQTGHEVTVADGETVNLDFEFHIDPAPAISGIVVDPDGRPLRGARVIAERRNDSLWQGVVTTWVGDDGRFTLEDVEDGSTVRATRGDWATIQPLTVGFGNRDQLRVVLQKNNTGTVLIRVVGLDGAPIANASLALIVQTGNMGLSSASDNHVTGPDGTYVNKSLKSDGNYTVDIKAQGFGYAQVPLTVQAGKQVEIPIALPRADSFIGGIVVDLTGQPLPDVQVRAAGRQTRDQTARTDVTGRFAFVNIVPGDTLSVYVQGENRISKIVQVPAGTGDAVVIHDPNAPAPAPRQ